MEEDNDLITRLQLSFCNILSVNIWVDELAEGWPMKSSETELNKELHWTLISLRSVSASELNRKRAG